MCMPAYGSDVGVSLTFTPGGYSLILADMSNVILCVVTMFLWSCILLSLELCCSNIVCCMAERVVAGRKLSVCRMAECLHGTL